VAEAVVKERDSGGPFKNFMDFLARLAASGVNKKILESLIQAGCFDSLGHRRRELVLNLEKALEWSANKLDYESSRQGSLFDSGDETVFPPFMMEHAEEYGRQDLLDFEKALLGFYFTGHPMDEHRMVWERSSTIDMAHLERAVQGKEYIVVALMQEFKESMTKQGRRMAFGVLADYSGTMDVVFFPEVFDQLRPQLAADKVFCFKGNFDGSRGKPSLQVKELLDPASLKERCWRELHMRLSAPAQTKYDEEELAALRDAVFSLHGSCSLIFHIPLSEERGEVVVKAGAHVVCSALDKDMDFLLRQPLVQEVWRD
jgi:DNA polymerase-3 subunit alpha